MKNPRTSGAEAESADGDERILRQGENGDFLPETPCFVVGIGASAGGQAPLEHLFTTIPTDCDLSFVVVMHLPPDGPPLLADLLRRYTGMEVLTAENGLPLLPNSVYVIPPGADLTVSGGRLMVERRPAMTAGVNHPIDRFFISLAAAYGERAIAVVLSGFGTDAAEGVKGIKACGGTVLVQMPDTAVNPPMPANAIATGSADLVLPMEEIPVKIAEIAKGRCNLSRGSCRTATLDEDLASILAAVKAKTGQDFSSYKKNTVMRRIERRMAVNASGGLGKYLHFLEQDDREAQALAEEILIGVTRFFRDPEAFEVLQREVLPRLFADRDPDDPVRIWHACCATGEEAYSVAMLIGEYLAQERLNNRVQTFATDIDEAAVAQARSGFYHEEIGPDVGEERLDAYFVRSMGRLQVVKEVREQILFACHNIIKDPPFSRLDLLVCRNFLIYLNPDMQKRLMSLFHLVLKPGGFLFLGASETVGHNSDLFAAVDKKWKIFQRREGGRREDILFPFTAPIRRPAREAVRNKIADVDAPTPGGAADRILVERYSPPCVVVNEQYEVLYISSRTRPYLEIPVGAPTSDVLKMAGDGLRPALRAAVYKSFAEDKPVVFQGVVIKEEQGERTVNLSVEPLAAHPSYGRLALVIMDPAPSAADVCTTARGESPAGEGLPEDMLIRQLEEQLRVTHEQLQFTSEQLEASNEGFMATNEELMSINEEFQSANEELQSTNEELEASKEELQALNEELVTVNAELQGKVEELNQANSDMENLFASSGIATLFLDRNLIIKRFSPAMADFLNLIPADIGRPFRHLSSAIDWSGLHRDAREVLEKLSPLEREVKSGEDDRCFIMRILPYRTLQEQIDGIVVTLVDITDLRRAEEEIRSAALFPLENPSPVLRLGRDGTVLFANRSAQPVLARWRSVFQADIPAQLQQCMEDALSDGVVREYDFEIGGRDISFVVSPFPERDYANLYGRDVTARRRAEEALRQAKEEWERTFDSVPDLIAILDDRHRITRVNRAMAQKLGMSPADCIGRTCCESVHGTEAPPDFCPHTLTIADGREHMAEVHEEHLGGDFLVSTTPLTDGRGRMTGAVHVARDITARKQAEAEILQQVDELERFNRASVGRELRMVEMKKEVNELCARLGEFPRYPLEMED